MVLELRKRLADKHGMPITGRIPLAAIRHPGFLQSVLHLARPFVAGLLDDDNLMFDLPYISGLMGGKRMPGLANKFLRDILPERSEREGKMTVSFYAGCLIDFVYPEIGQAIWKVLSAGDVTALFPIEQCCCGAPALYAGDQETARKLAADNVAALENGSPDYVVTGCPTCAVMLKEWFPTMLEGTEFHERAMKLSAKVMDFSQFASDVLNIDFSTTKAEGKVTYHDPCHQVRGLKTSDRSRKLIAAAGMDLVEMEDSDECCGFAGSFSIKQPGISASILNRKIGHIQDTEAGTVATDCPGCIMQIRGGLAKREMIALLAAQLHRLRPGHHLAVAEDQVGRRVVPQRVAAAFGLQPQDERRIAVDVDGRHMVHLDGDAELHSFILS